MLIENFRKAEANSRRLSGVDEEFTETDRILSELVEMIDNLEEESESKSRKEKEDEDAIEKIRSAALGEYKLKRQQDFDTVSSDGSERPRRKRDRLERVMVESNQAMMEHWKKEDVLREEAREQEREARIEEREARKEDLALRREELELQKRKIEMEEKDRQANQAMMLALVQALMKKNGD